MSVAESSMTLPVHSHLGRLSELVAEMRQEANQAQKDLHILRGCISQLSFVNKESDLELNDFLASSISAMRGKWAAEWDQHQRDIYDSYKKVAKLNEEQEDIDLKREELEDKVRAIEEVVGLVSV